MISVKKEGVILEKSFLEFENVGVINPAILQEGNTIHLFYRAVRKGNYSTIGYCKLDGPLNVVKRNDTPLLKPQFDYESHGIEDPRIVKIDELYYLTFASYDGINALGSLATSTDLINFVRIGVIVPQVSYEKFKQFAESNAHLNEKYERFHLHNNIKPKSDKKKLLWDKNLIFFPRKIKNKFCFLHRICPDIQIAFVNNISDLTPAYWTDYFLHLDSNIILSPKYAHEISYIGGGCPPVETKEGWLLIYHGVHDSAEGYVYSACAALLDIENPARVIARLPYPLIKPELPWELKGEVNNVIFPTGTALLDDMLYIYYGASDTKIGCASVSLKTLVAELLLYKV